VCWTGTVIRPASTSAASASSTPRCGVAKVAVATTPRSGAWPASPFNSETNRPPSRTRSGQAHRVTGQVHHGVDAVRRDRPHLAATSPL
jgi:hypothetical protein